MRTVISYGRFTRRVSSHTIRRWLIPTLGIPWLLRYSVRSNAKVRNHRQMRCKSSLFVCLPLLSFFLFPSGPRAHQLLPKLDERLLTGTLHHQAPHPTINQHPKWQWRLPRGSGGAADTSEGAGASTSPSEVAGVCVWTLIVGDYGMNARVEREVYVRGREDSEADEDGIPFVGVCVSSYWSPLVGSLQ